MKITKLLSQASKELLRFAAFFALFFAVSTFAINSWSGTGIQTGDPITATRLQGLQVDWDNIINKPSSPSCRIDASTFPAGSSGGATVNGLARCNSDEVLTGGGGYCGGCMITDNRGTKVDGEWRLSCVPGCTGGNGKYTVQALCCKY